jgi:hypothetical protein
MKVLGPHVKKEGSDLISSYSYKHTQVQIEDGQYICVPKED